MRKFLAVFCIVTMAALSACSSAPKSEEKTVIKQQHPGELSGIILTVGKVNIVDEVPADSEVSAREFHVPLKERLTGFLQENLRAEGSYGALEVALRNVSVKHGTEPSDNSFARMIDMAGYDVYTMDVEIELRRGAEHVQLYEGRRISAQRRVKMSEHLSYAKREKEQQEAVNAMLADLKEALVKNLSELQLIMPRLTIIR